MRLLLTGGAGYIGSHTALAALRAGHEILIIDDFSNSDESVIEALKVASGKDVAFVRADIRDTDKVQQILQDFKPDSVLHFAGVKSVGESVAHPTKYYDINVAGTVSLMKAMEASGTTSLVFSSSATVYGDPQYLPLDEDHPLSVTNPYGRSKLQVEDILRDQCVARPDWTVAILRYFNPVGADECGLIGESPRGVPANLMPYVADVAAGDREFVGVFGNDYDTRDGTGIRDYIHVADLAEAHVAAVGWTEQQVGAREFNLGGGQGTSVLEMIQSFKKASGKDVPYKILPRRPGDVASCFANPARADKELNWRVQRDIDAMCKSGWQWRQSALQDA
jgi:UDP-glucose 4-epimerase